MTETAPKTVKTRILADFDVTDREAVLQFLSEQLSKGLMLEKCGGFTGAMTFEPLPENLIGEVTYALIRVCDYENGGELSAPWKKCGKLGGFVIWRFTGIGAVLPQPDIDPAKTERSRRNHYIFLGVMWLLLAVMNLCIDIPKIISSARGFSENLNFLGLKGFLYIITGTANFGIAFPGKKKSPKTGHFKQFIQPWITAVLLIAFFTFGAVYCKGEKIPLPDSRLPFSEDSSVTGVPYAAGFKRSYAAEVYTYGSTANDTYAGCFLYKAYFGGLAERTFGEIREDFIGENYSVYPLQMTFENYTVTEPVNAAPYPAIDEIIRCYEDSDYYELNHRGLIVRSGNRIFGVCYKKEAANEEDILQYLNNFFTNS